SDRGHEDRRRLSKSHRCESHRRAMITARRGDHTGRQNFARQHVRERAASLERPGMLKEFEFKNDTERVETKVHSIHYEYRSATNIWSDNTLSCLNSLAREFVCLNHHEQY